MEGWNKLLKNDLDFTNETEINDKEGDFSMIINFAMTFIHMSVFILNHVV